MKSGSRADRELDIVTFRKKHVHECDGNCGCAFEKLEKSFVQTTNYRRSQNAGAVRERNAIRAGFTQHDKRNSFKAATPNELTTEMLLGAIAADLFSPEEAQVLQDLLNTPNRRPDHNANAKTSSPVSTASANNIKKARLCEIIDEEEGEWTWKYDRTGLGPLGNTSNSSTNLEHPTPNPTSTAPSPPIRTLPIRTHTVSTSPQASTPIHERPIPRGRHHSKDVGKVKRKRRNILSRLFPSGT